MADVAFDAGRITSAISRAMQATGEGSNESAEKVSEQVVVMMAKKNPGDHIPSIEEIQDAVESQLILMDFAKTAKAYILYRNERSSFARTRRKFRKMCKNWRRRARNISTTSLPSLFITAPMPIGSRRKAAVRRGSRRCSAIWILCARISATS